MLYLDSVQSQEVCVYRFDRVKFLFSDADRAAFDLAIAASQVPNGVTDAIAENIRNYWDEGEIVEILGVVALFGYLNRWNDSMGTELEQAAVVSAQEIIGKKGWEIGKHSY